MNLSRNFTLEEATRSHKAEMLHINNSMPNELVIDAGLFATVILQPLRNKIGKPFIVTSWYRCPALNKAVGGVNTSAHLSAMALDFTVAGCTANESFDLVLVALKDLRIQFDQLIIERNTKTGANWVHLGFKRYKNRNQTFSLIN